MEILSYKDILKSEFIKRRNNNSQYSLRSFAKYLKIDASQLSRVLSDKRDLSYTTASMLASKLFDRKRDQKYFLFLVEYAISNNKNHKLELIKKMRNIVPGISKVNLQIDTIRMITNWYHIAILDLTTLSNFNERFPSVGHIACFLGISKIETREAIRVLLDLGLLEKRENTYIKTIADLKSTTDIPHKSLREFHHQMISKAKEALDKQSVDERYVTSKTMAISKDIMPELKELIEEFKSNVGSLLNSKNNSETDSLYQLNIQLFDLEHSSKRRNA